MKENIKFKTQDDNYIKEVKIELPNSCLHCHQIMRPSVVGNYTDSFSSDEILHLGVLLKCTNCGKFFGVEYQATKMNHYNYAEAQLINYSYSKEIKTYLPKEIEEISSTFVEIYRQSLTAEAYDLFEIAGVGFRKSAEFLLKDFASSENPDDTEKIKKIPLMQVITTYFKNTPLYDVAKAVAWIGNDETHYVRKHSDKDREDLKEFIGIACNMVTMKYGAIKATRFITKED